MGQSERGWEVFAWTRLAGCKDKLLLAVAGIWAPWTSHQRVEAGRGGCFKPPDHGFH